MRGPLTILGGIVRRIILSCIHMLQSIAAMPGKSLSWLVKEPMSMSNPHATSDGNIKGKDRDLEDEDIFSTTIMQELLGSKLSIELQLLAFMLVFSASTLVPLLDLAFPLFVSLYTYVLSKVVFPCYPMEATRMEVFHGSRHFHTWIALGILLGFFLPLAFVLGSFSRGEQGVVRAATPHLFLLTAQMVSELFVSGDSGLSPPCRIILTLLYTSRRLSTLAHWVVDAFSYHPLQPLLLHDSFWLWFGRGLPVANFLYCNIYMFYFLIPKFLLRAFERYIMAKRAYITLHTDESSQMPNSSTTLEDKKKDGSKEMDNLQENEIKRFKGTSTGKEKDKESEKVNLLGSQDPRSPITSVKDNKLKDKDKGKQKE